MARNSAVRKQSNLTLKRQVIFWLVTLVIFIALVWLLSDVLLPFVAGIALAYLLDPLVRRIQRLGVNRTLAAVALVLIVLLGMVIAGILLVPILGDQIAAFIDKLPGYVEKVQALVTDSNREWLTKIVGERLPEASKSVGPIAAQAAAWIAVFLKSLWSGGKALVSLVSLLVITPIELPIEARMSPSAFASNVADPFVFWSASVLADEPVASCVISPDKPVAPPTTPITVPAVPTSSDSASRLFHTGL